jgi:O-antigen/teichoic acid export membrane protein
MIRYLGSTRLGVYQDVVNLTALVSIVLDVGFNTLFQREAARRPGELSDYLAALIPARLLFSLPALGILTGLLYLQGKSAYLWPGFVMMVLASGSNLLRGGLYAVERLGYEVVAIVLETVVLLGAVLVGVATHQGVGYFLWAYALMYGFSCVYFLVVLTTRRIAHVSLRLDVAFVRAWFWKGLPFAFTFVITAIYFKIDVPILNQIHGDQQTGWYAAAYKLFEALLFLPQSMLSVVFPVLAVLHRERKHRLPWSIERLYKGLFLLGWPIALGTLLLAPAFRVIYSYPESTLALRLLALGIVFMFVNNAFIGALNATDHQASFTWAALWSMVANVILNLALIPPFGYLGAAVATVLTEVALCVFGWILTARHVMRVPVLRLSWRGLLAGLVMLAAILPFRDVTGLPAVAVIMGAVIVYGLALLLVRAIDAEEWALIRRALEVRGMRL